MTDRDSDMLRQRYELAKTKRAPIEDELDWAYYFTSPQGAPKYIRDQKIDRHKHFDSTAELSINDWVNVIMQFMVPRDQKWMNILLSEEFKQQIANATKLLDVLLASEVRKFYQAINGSNFFMELAKSMKDLGISGTGGIAVHMYKGNLAYRSLPIAQLFYLDNGICEVDVVFREHELPARTVIEMYDKVPEWIKEINKTNPDKPIKVIESMTPAKVKGKHLYQVHTDKWERLQRMQCDYKPFIVFRWDQLSGITWGDSLVRKMLPDIKTLNLMVADLLTMSANTTLPPMETDSPEQRDQYPTSGNVYIKDQNSTGMKPITVTTSGGFQIEQVMIESYRAQVRRGLMADSLAGLGDRATTKEVDARQAEFFRRIGVYSLRLEEELLEPLVEASIKLLQQNGKMQKFELDDKKYCLVLNSLQRRAEAQREADEMLIAMQRVAMFKEAAQTTNQIDLLAAERHILTAGGFPAEMMRSMEEVEQEAKMQAAATAMAGMTQIQSGQAAAGDSAATGAAVAKILPDIGELFGGPPAAKSGSTNSLMN